MVWEGTQGQNMRPNRLSHMLKSSMNTVLFVNATIGFFWKPFSSFLINCKQNIHTALNMIFILTSGNIKQTRP